MARICSRVAERGWELTDRIVGILEEEIPEYAGQGGVPRGELRASVHENLQTVLSALATNRSPLPQELERFRELGRRRALRGLPVVPLLQAFHVGYRELWAALVEEARAEGGRTAELLLAGAATVWGWVHDVTNALAEEHQQVTRGRQEALISGQQRLLELLVSGDLDSEELLELARSQGFDPEGNFQALALRVEEAAAAGASNRLRELLRAARGTHVCAARASEVLVLLQDARIEEIEGLVLRAFPQAPVGAGALRPGLWGAHTSIGDAERALAVSVRRGQPSRFERDWFPAMLLEGRRRLSPLVAAGAEVARRFPHLAEAVRAFAEAGFSLTLAARRLSVHINTVVYRLDRWRALTGWDPRSAAGLLSSLAAIELAADRPGQVPSP